MKLNLEKVAELGGNIGEGAKSCLFGLSFKNREIARQTTFEVLFDDIRRASDDEIKQLINCIDVTEEDEAQAAEFKEELKKRQMEGDETEGGQLEEGDDADIKNADFIGFVDREKLVTIYSDSDYKGTDYNKDVYFDANNNVVYKLLGGERKILRLEQIKGKTITLGSYRLLCSLAPLMDEDGEDFVKITQVDLAEINDVSRRTIQLEIEELTNIEMEDGRPLLEANVKNGVGSEFRLHPEVLHEVLKRAEYFDYLGALVEMGELEEMEMEEMSAI